MIDPRVNALHNQPGETCRARYNPNPRYRTKSARVMSRAVNQAWGIETYHGVMSGAAPLCSFGQHAERLSYPAIPNDRALNRTALKWPPCSDDRRQKVRIVFVAVAEDRCEAHDRDE